MADKHKVFMQTGQIHINIFGILRRLNFFIQRHLYSPHIPANS
ncbi:hypothetical protein TR2A62_0881 [Thalassobium sp. R2A62]|nr:hypothetical protein TR2A62_0881 [Thalassobium sp. R2A62]